MRHGKKIHKLSRPAEHRKALLNNLAAALIKHKQIQTTETKAKALKPFIDRLISTALQDTLHAKRQVAKNLPNKVAFKELFSNVIPKLEGRTSGFSRIVKHKARRGDGAPISIIELLLEKEEESKGKKKKAGKKAAASKAKTKAGIKPGKTEAEEVEPEIEQEAQAEAVEQMAEETVQEDATPEETPQEQAGDGDEKKE
jgi:large subunit ribosomal protein L17